jgi:hypothetical protein
VCLDVRLIVAEALVLAWAVRTALALVLAWAIRTVSLDVLFVGGRRCLRIFHYSSFRSPD